ncbi:MAG: hypothetical protein WB919_14505 [Candidatus Sulfotelmatobacter sp.]
MRGHILVCLALLAAQATVPEVEIAAEPHHHLALENTSVRVFYVDVPPRTETLMHWHRHDYIAVNLGDAEVVNAVKDRPPVVINLQDAQTIFSPATFAHIARNLADQPFRNVTIEILEDEALRRAHPNWDEDRALITFEGRTQQILFVKDAIRVSELELEPGAVIPMHHHAGPHLLVAVNDLDLHEKFSNDVHPIDIGNLKSGECKWLSGNYSHAITNTGPKLAKFVTLEFP